MLKIDKKLIPLCYDPSVPTWIKYKFKYVLISSWTSSPYKPVFKGELYPWVCNMVDNMTNHPNKVGITKEKPYGGNGMCFMLSGLNPHGQLILYF